MTKLVLFSIGLVGFLGIITSGLTTKAGDKTTNILPAETKQAAGHLRFDNFSNL